MIPLYKVHIPEAAKGALEKVLDSGQIAGDGNFPVFEQKLREVTGARHLVLTAEFSRSVEMALRMAGVGVGDGVLVSPLTCLATTMPILQVGARPVWCDLDPQTGGILAGEVTRQTGPNIRAVLLYHWVGYPADIDGVLAAARSAGIAVIEDAGEALGAEYRGQPVGSHGADYSIFSFNPVRHITTGEGAAIVFRDPERYAIGRIWRKYGIPEQGFRDEMGELNPQCDITVPGFHNYMNRISGLLGEAQMEALPGIIAKHRSNGDFYNRQLAGIPGLSLLPCAEGNTPSYWVYCFRCQDRAGLLRKLREAGIYASGVHIRNDLYSCFGTEKLSLPRLEEFERTQLCIPCGWWVSEEDREFIAKTIRSGW